MLEKYLATQNNLKFYYDVEDRIKIQFKSNTKRRKILVYINLVHFCKI